MKRLDFKIILSVAAIGIIAGYMNCSGGGEGNNLSFPSSESDCSKNPYASGCLQTQQTGSQQGTTPAQITVSKDTYCGLGDLMNTKSYVLNAVYRPQGTSIYKTRVSLTNTSGAALNVSAAFTPSNGQNVKKACITMPAAATRVFDNFVDDAFNISTGGWGSVVLSVPNTVSLNGIDARYYIYDTSVSGAQGNYDKAQRIDSSVTSPNATQKSQIVSGVENADANQDVIAIYNLCLGDAVITVENYKNGSKLGTVTGKVTMAFNTLFQYNVSSGINWRASGTVKQINQGLPGTSETGISVRVTSDCTTPGAGGSVMMVTGYKLFNSQVVRRPLTNEAGTLTDL